MTIGSLDSASAIGQDWVGAPRPRPVDAAQGLLERQASQVRDTVEISSRARAAGQPAVVEEPQARKPAVVRPGKESQPVARTVAPVPQEVLPPTDPQEQRLAAGTLPTEESAPQESATWDGADSSGDREMSSSSPVDALRGPISAYARPVQVSTRSWVA